MDPETPMLPEPAPAPPAFEPGGLERDRSDAVDPFGPRPRRESFFKRRIAPIGAAILAFLTKIKSIILLAPKFKLLVTAGTMVVSVVAYATIWGYSFALGFVILLLVHEMGHVIALRARGHSRQRADVHPLPGRGHQRPVAG